MSILNGALGVHILVFSKSKHDTILSASDRSSNCKLSPAVPGENASLLFRNMEKNPMKQTPLTAGARRGPAGKRSPDQS